MEARLSGHRCMWAVLGAVLLVMAPAASAAKSPTTFEDVIARVKTEMVVDPSVAGDRALDALRIASSEPDRNKSATMRATALWLRGEAFNRLGATNQALPLLAEAHNLVDRAPQQALLLGDILLAQGSALTDAGRITEALVTLQRAHAQFLRLQQGRSRAKALILIAMLYDAARDHQTALRYFQQANDAFDKDPGLLVAIFNSRGTALDGLGRYAAAEAEFAKALPIARQMQSSLYVAQLLGNVAHSRFKQGHLTAAEEAIAQATQISRDPAAGPVRPQLTYLAAEAAFRRHDMARAVSLIEQRFHGVDLNTTIIADRDAHEIAYRVYLARGETALALRHLSALKRLDDQATQIARSTSAALAAARFDYTNQELRIAKLKATDLARSVAYERAAARTQWQIFVGAALGTALVIALLAVALFTIRRSRNVVRAANADLETTNGKLEKALAAKTEFLATTSHEIRTPLNGILGMTQVMIADRALDPATRERLAVVHGAGTTMRALVDDILDVAKIETGKMTIEAHPIDLVATVEDAARIWRDQAAAKGLSFDTRIALAHPWVLGDAARLRQIVFNLLSNAVKFTPAGGIVLILEQAGEEAAGRMRLSVADSGIGIDRTAHEVIFESFRQADAGTTRQFGGTGLGLSICRNLARAMGGDVTVASAAGDGATFTLDLPLVAAEAPGATPQRPGLLVVERNPIQRAMLRTLFAAIEPIAFADDGEAAAAIATAQKPLRVLADAASIGDRAALAALAAAAAPAPVFLLAPSGEGATWRETASATVIERPIGKKNLVNQVMAHPPSLVPQAA